MKTFLGIDLGGTFIKFALVDQDMNIVASLELPTPAAKGPEGVIATMIEGGRQLIGQSASSGAVAGIGIGSPGPLDLKNGLVIAMPNIAGFDRVPLSARVGAGLNLPAVLENDANAAGLGEYLCGGGKGTDSMVLLTLGTGIGAGIVVDGHALHGAHGIGAEVGHLILVPNGELCGCGQRGCLERYASATYLSLLAQRAIAEDGRKSALAATLAKKGSLDARDVNLARRAGDELAAEIWDQAIFYLALASVNLCRIFDPDLIVFGGGMAKAGEDLMAPLRRHFAAQHWRLTEPMTRLELAQLGNDAGVIGAAAVARERFA